MDESIALSPLWTQLGSVLDLGLKVLPPSVSGEFSLRTVWISADDDESIKLDA